MNDRLLREEQEAEYNRALAEDEAREEAAEAPRAAAAAAEAEAEAAAAAQEQAAEAEAQAAARGSSRERRERPPYRRSRQWARMFAPRHPLARRPAARPALEDGYAAARDDLVAGAGRMERRSTS